MDNIKAQDRKAVLFCIAACISALIILFAALLISEYVKYLSCGVASRTVKSVQYARYSGEPFSSEVLYKRTLTKKECSELDSALKSGKVIFDRSFEVNTAAKVEFDDGTSMILLIAKEAIGIDYGRVYIQAPGIENIFWR